MGWKGTVFGALIGFLATRSVWGAVIGLIIGYVIDQGTGARSARAGGAGYAPEGPGEVSEVFFRTTFELMGHVAKSDGPVSEAEIEAARRLMQQLNLGPNEVSLAIACFRAGKSPAYDVELAVERLREACGLRHDLLRAFIELQLRAALAGNGLSPPARLILTRVAERLGISGLEFARMEAALRAREQARGVHPLADSYTELEVEPSASDQEVTTAYRRQMSRHHPDKLVANGLPESMAQVAKEKTQRIQEAYEAIRAARAMR
ncbi:MAG: co-chaperone DjlA [Steroidobacterales bacterium]